MQGTWHKVVSYILSCSCQINRMFAQKKLRTLMQNICLLETVFSLRISEVTEGPPSDSTIIRSWRLSVLFACLALYIILQHLKQINKLFCKMFRFVSCIVFIGVHMLQCDYYKMLKIHYMIFFYTSPYTKHQKMW